MDNLVGRFRLKTALESSKELNQMLDFACIQYIFANPLTVSSGDVSEMGIRPSSRQNIYQLISGNTMGFIRGTVIPSMVSSDAFLGAITACGLKGVEDFFKGTSATVPNEAELKAVFTSSKSVDKGYEAIGSVIEYCVSFPEMARTRIGVE